MKQFASFACWLPIILTSLSSPTETNYPFEVQTSGQGKQAIVFIPGFASSGQVWGETKTYYEKKYKCYTLTMAGFAGVNPQENPSFENWEKGIATYIQDHEIEKPIIVGHSMGGGLAMALAADYPDLISKIVVVDALPCLSAMMNPTFKVKEKNDCSEMTTQIVSATKEQFYGIQKMSISRLLADTSMHETVIDWSMNSDRKTFAEMYCDFTNTDLRAKIATIKCPNLILLEAYFVNFKPAINEQFKAFKNVNLQYADKGLHFIMYDDKVFYKKQITNFIKP